MRLFGIIFLSFLILILNGCSQPKRQYLPPKIAENINSILVLPFDICPEKTENIFFCPVKNIIPGYIEPYAKETMNRLLRLKLVKFSLVYKFKCLSQNEFENLMAEILEETSSLPEIIKNLAKKTDTQAVLYGRIYRFKERKGSSFSVRKPASVAFALVLYDGFTGKILWNGYFDKTQQPLSENILDIRIYKKFKWLTAEELASNGLDLVLQTFPLKEE